MCGLSDAVLLVYFIFVLSGFLTLLKRNCAFGTMFDHLSHVLVLYALLGYFNDFAVPDVFYRFLYICKCCLRNFFGAIEFYVFRCALFFSLISI